MDNFLRRLTPGQLRFISSVCRAILGFNDGYPRTFRVVVNLGFVAVMLVLSLAITWALSPVILAFCDDPPCLYCHWCKVARFILRHLF